MGFKKTNLILPLLLTLMILSALSLGWALSSALYHLSVILTALLVLEVLTLYRQLTRTTRDVLFFFRALENDDSSIRFSKGLRNSLTGELNSHLERLNQNFSEMKLSHELREQYFNRILENISSGLLVISDTGHVNHINRKAISMLNISNLTHIRALNEVDPGLFRLVEELEPDMKKEIILKDRKKGIKRTLGLQCTSINLKGEDVRVVSLQDLSAEMEQKEIEDWIRLIRIMSHEIMNSLAPITSISTTLSEMWSEVPGKEDQHNGPRIDQTIRGLDAIAEQSQGLTTFFESYRMLSRIPDPDKKKFPVCSFFEKIETLILHDKTSRGIDIRFSCNDPELKIHGDEQMIAQVLVNLVKNAIQAVEEIAKPAIEISARQSDEGSPSISVRDNGKGIPPEISDEVFLPFFTTGDKGTGVGLSYSRQVINLHGGHIGFQSCPGNTEFILSFT